MSLISISKNANPNYLAKVVLVPTIRDVKGLDNLGAITIDGRDILTQKSTPVGNVSIYFPSGSRLNHDFLSKNNDYRKADGLNADIDHNGGFFEPNRRVKPLKLKGIVSDGYVVPIATLSVLIGDKYKILESHVGEEFDTIGDIVLLDKWIKPVAQTQVPGEKKPRDRNKGIKKFNKVIEEQFKFHYDTTHLDKNLHRIEPDDLISLTWKLHGTSFISSKVLCRRKLSRIERIAKWFGAAIRETEYEPLYSSRSVIKNKELNPNAIHYYGTDVYGQADKLVRPNLLNGETVYGEIVGYTDGGKPIQGQYDYGCQPGQFKLYVYRITYTNDKGQTVDVPYKLMSERCEQMGLEPVPLIFQGKARDLVDKEHVLTTDDKWRETFYEFIKKNYIGGKSRFCKNPVPEEGIVLRREGIKPFALKFVSPEYKLKESKAKDDGVVDMEEEQENGTE